MALRIGACRCRDKGSADPMIPICDDQERRARACQGYGVGAAGMEGVTVTGAEEEAGGRLAVWARVSCPAICPGCGTVSERVHEYVTTRPRDVRYGSREVDLFLEKRRLACGNGACPRGTFTEWAPQVPPRCRVTRRLLEQCGDEVAERGITPAESARHNGVSWPSAHRAFAEKADAVLAGEPEPVA